MKWFALILSSLPAALLGIVCGGYIGKSQIRWFRLAEANGTQYFTVIAWAFYGGIIGLVVGLVAARMLSAHATASGLRSVAASCGAMLALSLVALGTSRYFAHIPPTIDGQRLTLQIELRLPPGHAKPAAPKKASPSAFHETVTSSFYLTSVNTIGRDRGEIGFLNVQAAREEDGRWIAPGYAPINTSRGKRALDFHVDGQDLPDRFIAPVPAHPGAESLQWSRWLPEHDDSGQPWPDSKPSYRFRIQKIEADKEEAALALDEKSVFARDKAKLNAIPADAPLEAYFEFTRYNAPTGIKSLALEKMAAGPNFAVEMKAMMLNADADVAKEVLSMIEHVPHPTAELITAVEFVGQDLADRMRKVNATPAKLDPDFLLANDVAIRFYGWINAVAKLRAKDGGDFIPELRTIVELSRVRSDLEVIRRDVRRVAVSCLSEWAGVPPQPGDPKP